MLQLIQQGVLLLGTLTGAATDARTGYIYDWITYPMILVGAVLSIAQMQWNNIIIAVVLFLLMAAGYKLGKIGGGDVKIFAGIALLNPISASAGILESAGFLAALGFFAAASAMVFYAVYYAIKYIRKAKGIKWKENAQGIIRAIMLGAVLIVYFVMMSSTGLMNTNFAYSLGMPLCIGLIFVALQKGIRKEFFLKKVPVGKIEEDEVIAPEANEKKVLKLLRGKQLIGLKEAGLLKKHGIKFVFVLRDLPKFGPFIFIGVIGALIQPNFFSLIFLR